MNREEFITRRAPIVFLFATIQADVFLAMITTDGFQ
jgi:hypothetical protein